MKYTPAQVEREIARCDGPCRALRWRAWICNVKLWFLWLPKRLGFQWAHRAADNLRDERGVCRYAREEHGMNAARWKRLLSELKGERTLPDFAGTLQEAMEDCGCKSWEDAMRALVAGAVEHDDQDELVFRCGEVADLRPKPDGALPWSETIGMSLEFFRGAGIGSEYQVLQAQELIRGGQLADAVARGEVCVVGT